VREITGGRGADLILDPVGGKGFGRNLAMLAPLGMVISYGRLDGPPDPDFGSAMRAHSGQSPVFHWTTDRDADDVSDLHKSPAYDIRKDRLELFINTDQKFINEYFLGAPTNYAVILLPQNQMPQNFSTLRQAKILGAKVIQLGAQKRSVHRSSG
jgi:hypothetical protein